MKHDPPRLTLRDLRKQETHIKVQCRSVYCYHESVIELSRISTNWDNAKIEDLPFRCKKCRKMLVMWDRIRS